MHELSIVLNIVEIVEKEVFKADAESVSAVELDIGKLSTIEPAAFEFAWKHGIRDSVLERAELKINYIQGMGRCSECNTLFEMNALYDSCPECGCYFSEIIEGKEMNIKTIRIEERLKSEK
ncbi:MAG: hydrogenase maturation nickel metallochaperone HypA [Balneolaceae bacterium]|uniref:hydrogenase maturation nickel metallochaperone HypA/HybF n=1 Tax=Rhodohalobacter sp. TaxID=1974210 RepID=UPI002ACE208E|nr:hydrogenase maturation nickel metallochaperone HypA [Rhodohalobacter sp.]MDZ7717430.1 hydrogenase maturation nickel metallochaperone HypA [Balneolaceae bacterium]MDZ7755108.1 hydrogenase maturation nickel metallochaperone HypA [Rhodohalobacter sp.]